MCIRDSVFVDGRSSHRTDRGLSVKSVLVSGRSSQVSSLPRPRKRVMLADDTPVFACVSECRRSTQRPRRTNLSVMGGVRPEIDNKKTTARHSSMLACKFRPFSLFFSSRRVQISGSVEDCPVLAITVDTATDVSVASHAWLMSHPTLRSVTIQQSRRPPLPCEQRMVRR